MFKETPLVINLFLNLEVPVATALLLLLLLLLYISPPLHNARRQRICPTLHGLPARSALVMIRLVSQFARSLLMPVERVVVQTMSTRNMSRHLSVPR